MKRTIRLIEKASIDWNNYLTPEEVQKLKSKNDVDKADVAGDIIDSKEFKDKLENFKKSGWTYEELVDNLLSFCWNGNLTESDSYNMITLYHNTSNENAVKINKEGIRAGLRVKTYGKGNEAEGSGIWCTNVRGYGYGGATITFKIDGNDEALWKANDTEYIVYRDVKPEEIIDIDLVISDIPSNPNRRDNINSTVESDIVPAIEYYGKDDVLKVLGKNARHFAQPYNLEQFKHLIDTGEKYCKGNIYN